MSHPADAQVFAAVSAWLAAHWRLLLPLVCAHLLADFPLQTGAMVRGKRQRGARSPALWLHAGIAGAVGYLLLAGWQAWWILPALAVGHGLIDATKRRFGESARTFLLDQLAHLLLIVGLAWLVARSGAPVANWLPADAWILVIAVLLVWSFEGVLVGLGTRRWRAELADTERDELDAAGLWIGRLERILILVFTLAGHLEAVGFLVTAKSIFRFDRVGGEQRRKESEYFVLGTLSSFALALLTALAARALIGRLP